MTFDLRPVVDEQERIIIEQNEESPNERARYDVRWAVPETREDELDEFEVSGTDSGLMCPECAGDVPVVLRQRKLGL